MPGTARTIAYLDNQFRGTAAGGPLAVHNDIQDVIATLGARTIVGTANQIVVANADGISGSPTISLPGALVFGAATAVSLVPGAASSPTSAGSTLTITGGPGGATSGAGGAVTIAGGVPVVGAGGAVNITAGAGVGTNQNGGAAAINAGNATGSGTAGNITAAAGSGGTTGTAGAVTISGGAGGSASGAGGAVSLVGGTPTSGSGGGVNLTAAAGVGTTQNGGNVVITAGAATSGGVAGVVTLATAGGTQVQVTDTPSAARSLQLTGGAATGIGGTIGASSGAVAFGTNLARTVAAAITAAGTNQAGATALTADTNHVATVAANSGVRLPAAVAGLEITLVNRGASTLNVYPATGAQVDAAGSNVAVTMASNTVKKFSATTATQWWSQVAASSPVSTPPLSVKQFGAVGDNTSRPLSTLYGSNAAAQAAYPLTHAAFGITTADELDWAATQEAIETVRTGAAGGGTVLAPAGVHKWNRTLTLPECNQDDSARTTKQVNFIGEGDPATTIKITTDLGAGIYAIDYTLGTSRCSHGVMSDFRLIGPGGSPAFGTAPCNMHGIKIPIQRRCYRISSENFNRAFAFSGDQMHFVGLRGVNSYFGLYYYAPDASHFGDVIFTDCVFGGGTWAAVGIHPDNTVLGAVFDRCFFGVGPYCFYKLTTGDGSVSPTNSMVEEVQFNHCQFEAFGNAVFSDDKTSTTRLGQLLSVDFNMCAFTWNNSYKYGPNVQLSAFDVSAMVACRINQLATAGNFKPGGDAGGSLFRVDSIQGFHFESHYLEGLFDYLTSVSKPIWKGNAGADIIKWTLEQTGEWRGRVLECGGTIASGNVLAWMNGTGGTYGNGAVSVSAGIATESIAGIAKLAGVSGTQIPVVTSGLVNFVTSLAGGLSRGLVKAGAAGNIVQASNYGDATTAKTLGHLIYSSGGTTYGVMLMGFA